MLEVLLLRDIAGAVVSDGGIEARGAGLGSYNGKPGLGFDDGVATLGSLDQLRVLFLEQAEVAFGFPGPDAVGGEDEIHLLKGALVGFGIQGPDHGDSDDVGGTKDIVSLLFESSEDVRQHHSKPAVANGPADDTPGVTLGTNFQGKDFSRVKPWDSKPSGTKGGSEQEDHGDGAIGIAFSSIFVTGSVGSKTGRGKTSSAEHGNTLDNRAPVESPATTDPVKCEHTDEGSEHVGDGVEARDPLDGRVGNAGSAEDGGSEDGDTSDTDPFLHDLKPDNELDPTASMKLAGPNTEEHVEIRLRSSRLALKLSNIPDVLKLSLRFTEILAALASKTSENVASFLLAANLDQPTGRLGKEPYDGQEDKQEEDLEGDGESPGE